MSRRTGWIALAGIAFGAAPSPAAATILQAIGGPGGAPFELRCDEDEHVVGVRANVGAWIDGFALLCAKDGSPDGRQVGWVGGRGGMDQEAYCPSGGRALSFEVNFTRAERTPRKYLNAVSFRCDTGTSTCIDSGQGCDWQNREPSFWAAFTSPEGQSCPDDEVLVGFVGRSGKYVDAIGAICGRPRSSSAQNSPAPPPPRTYSDRPGPGATVAAQQQALGPEVSSTTGARPGEERLTGRPSGVDGSVGEVLQGSSAGANALNPQPLPPREPNAGGRRPTNKAARPSTGRPPRQ